MMMAIISYCWSFANLPAFQKFVLTAVSRITDLSKHLKYTCMYWICTAYVQISVDYKYLYYMKGTVYAKSVLIINICIFPWGWCPSCHVLHC